MMKFLRSQSQTVLIIVLGVIGLGFLFYGNSGNLLTSAGGHISNDYGRIDGSDLSVADLYSAVRNTRDTLLIQGHARELSQPGSRERVAQEAWRQLLLMREADRLHIQVSDQELIDYIRNQPLFQKDGVYSPDAYQTAMGQFQTMLRIPPDNGADPLATAKATFEVLMRNSIRANAASNALFSSVRNSVQAVSADYDKYYGPTSVSLVSFAPKAFESKVQVTPEEIEAAYKAHPENPAYRTKEKRKVDYVVFELPPGEVKLTPGEKSSAIEALGEKALDFALAFQPEPSATSSAPAPTPDFVAEAKKRGLNPVTTDFFTVDTPPSGLPPSPSFNNAAFELSKDNTISKVIELGNGVAIIHLSEIQPSDLLPLDQVKADITQALIKSKAVEAEQLAAQSAAQALKAAVAKGTDFKTAAASLNLKVETVPPFVPIKAPTTDPRLQLVGYVVTSLEPGGVSEPVPSQADDSMLIVSLDSRAKADPAGLSDFATRFGEQQNEQLRSYVYLDWANWETNRPGTHKPPDLDAYGSIE